jgi:hypothetical protein
MSTLSDADSTTSLQHELANIVNQWEKHAGKYFVLAEQETDPLGQKFYRSSAMAYANCATSVRCLLDQARPVLHTTQAAI